MMSVQRRRFFGSFLFIVVLILLVNSSVAGQSTEQARPPEPDETAVESDKSTSIVNLFWHKTVSNDGATLGNEAVSVDSLDLPDASQTDAKQVAEAFMNAYQLKLGYAANEAVAWQPLRAEMDEIGFTHVALQQTYQGLPVFAAQTMVHVLDGVGVDAANGEYPAAIDLSIKPAITEAAAYKTASHAVDLLAPVKLDSQLLIFNPALISSQASLNHLAYQFVLGDAEQAAQYVVFVDAHTGKLVFSYENLQEARDRQIYDLNGSTSLPGSACYTEGGPVGGSLPSDCTEAYNFTGDTYDYLFSTFGRDSFDDGGASMVVSVRYGTTANAFWDGSQTVFGPGFAKKDVVAHEWTHAVTQHTAGLVYSYQSGALNESMSDVFGTMVDRDDWLMGEDTPIGVIRSLADPTLYGNPGKVSDSEYYCGTGDNGGVHFNSGVPNHTAYLMAEGGTYNGHTISAIGREATEQIFYRTLTNYLTSGSDFVDAANGLNSSCSDLYGAGSAICTSVQDSVLATEMASPACGTTSTPPDSFEDDDTYTAANPIVVNGAGQTHNFHDAGDNDWVKFDTAAGGPYVLETSNLGSSSDTFMYLYDTDGSTLIANDDDGGTGLASRIAWTAPTAGTYYIRIRHYSSGAHGANTEYDLTVTGTTPPPPGADAFEEDDTAAQASVIVPNGPVQQLHNFIPAGDHDWAKFTAASGTIYLIETLNLGTGSDTVLELYDQDSTTLLRANDDGGPGLASRIEWTAPANGIYYIRVRHYSSSATGLNTNYDLSLTTVPLNVDTYETDDISSQASLISVNTETQSHNFHDAGDIDWVKFTATAGTSYVIETFNLESRSDTFIYLYGTDASTLIADDDDGGDGLASRISWTAPASGTYFVRIRHYSSLVYGDDTFYDLHVTGTGSPGGDAYEVDDTAVLHTPITVNGAAQSHTFHDAGDLDWISFTANVGVDYVIETYNLGSRSDTYLYLYGSDATTLIADNDDGGAGLASRISWTAPAGGTYYILVRHYSSSIFGADTDYDIHVTGSDPGVADSYENDDIASSSSVITVDGPIQTHNFHDAGDHDWVRFSATAGTSYTIETLNLGSRSDTYIDLYHPDASTLIQSNDDGGAGLASRIDWTPATTGTYYVRVRHYSSTMFGANTDYDLRVITGYSGSGDIYEPDNNTGQSTNIATDGSMQTHNFHVPGDQDWVNFTAVAGDTYTIETLNLGSSSDTYLFLYDTDGSTLIASNDDGGSGLASRISWTATAGGTYYAKVRHYASSASGADTNYDLRVERLAGGGVFEPNNTPSTATPIIVDAPAQTHDFYVAGDLDWLYFDALAGVSYVLETSNLCTGSDTYMYFYEPDASTLIDYNDDGGVGLASKIEWTASTSDRYYMRLRHYNSSSYGDNTCYDISVVIDTDAGGDIYEVDDAAGLASAITVNGGAQTHNFHDVGDQDWVSFAATAGAGYDITTFNLGSSSDTYLYLYNTDGVTIIDMDDDGGDGLASHINWIAPANGTYYVRVRHYSSYAFGLDTNYDLQITADFGGPDGYEPDNSSGAANTIDVDLPEIQSHNFHADGDEDWVFFSGIDGENCLIETLNLGSRSDTYLDFYDSGPSLIASDDDSGPGLASRIVINGIPGSQTYYTKVRHYSSSVSGADTDYDLQISCSGGSDDVYEPDNSPAEASTITVNGPVQTHNIHVQNDNDWIKFSALAGTSYVLETSNLGSSADTYMYLYDTDGTSLITLNDDGGVGLASRIAWTAPSNGTYYIRIRHFSSSSFGPDTNYDLGVITSASLSALPVSVALAAPTVHQGGELEAFVYLSQPAESIKVEASTKATYLQVTDVSPLTESGKVLNELSGGDIAYWQVEELGDSVSVWMSGKTTLNADQTNPVLRIRWQVLEDFPNGKLNIPLHVTVVDQYGQTISQVVELTGVMSGSQPKIDNVTPVTIINDTDTVITVYGSSFVETPKVYLVGDEETIQLNDVVLISDGDGVLHATVPAGTKTGTYKLRLVNPDLGSVEYQSIGVELRTYYIFLPVITRN